MRLFGRQQSIFKDTNKPMNERLFYLLSAVGLWVLAAVLLGALFLGEASPVIAALGLGWLLFFLIRRRAIRTGKVEVGIHLIATVLIMIILPIGYFSGGGLQGGSAVWFIFAFVYAAFMIKGRALWFFWGLTFVVQTICYMVSYLYPDIVTGHTPFVAHVDSYISITIISFTICFMIEFQNSVFRSQQAQSDQQRHEIEDLSKAQNRFFSTMSHEIRTPINTIIGLNEMNLRQDDISDEVAENSMHIQAASKVLLSLINDILDMSKLQSGKMSIVHSPYNVTDLVSEVVGMMGIRASEKDLVFHVDVDETMPRQLVGDEVRIKQVLINLLTNAIKYTPSGTVTMSIQCVSVNKDIATISFSVADTGIGIKKENIPDLFNAFKRMDEERNSQIEGTGLGLSIVKQLVDVMGGEIGVNSIYTKGSTFVVTLPQQIGEAEPIGEIKLGIKNTPVYRETYKKSFEAPGARILIVDDNEVNLLVETKLLRDTKAQIETASSGREAISKALQSRYDLIFMDHLMPEVDGIEALHAIRLQVGGQNRGTPIIALTANADNSELYRREGFDDQLLKPVSGADLQSALLTYLPKSMVRMTGEGLFTENKESTIFAAKRKRLVIITSESVCDLPQEIVEEKKVPLISFSIATNEGEFTDGTEIRPEGVLAFIASPERKATGRAPSVAEYEDFFAERLETAQFVIHISTSKKMSEAYANAVAASGTYDNVIVVDSGQISCGMGLQVLEACRMAERGLDIESIISGIRDVQNRISTTFMLETMYYLAQNGRIPPHVLTLSEAFMMRPVVELRDSIMKPKSMRMGKTMDLRREYIRMHFRYAKQIDRSILFIPYSGLDPEELKAIERIIREYIVFEEVVFQHVSCTSSVIFGPGAFGLVYTMKKEADVA